MNSYPFPVAEHAVQSRTLELLEDLANRRMIDWCYLHEKDLPGDYDAIAKEIGMRSHEASIADVLEFFWSVDPKTKAYYHPAIRAALKAKVAKSEQAKQAARTRWDAKRA